MKVRGTTRSKVAGRVAQALLIGAVALIAGCSNGPTAPPPIVQPPPPPPPAPPPPPPVPPTTRVTRILAFGDSMTEGVASSPLMPMRLLLDPGLSRSYPFKLQELMTARYTSQTVNVFNVGWAGRRAADDRGRFSDALSEARPDLVILLEGANDLNFPFAVGEGVNARLNATLGYLEDMVRDTVARGIPIYIGTLPPQRPGGNGSLFEQVGRFNGMIREMAGKKGADVVDFGQLPLSLIGVDGLHPTEAGYQRMAEIALDAIKAKYETSPSEIR